MVGGGRIGNRQGIHDGIVHSAKNLLLSPSPGGQPGEGPLG